MLCTKCGSQIADDAKFCPFCGQKSTQPEASTQNANYQFTQQQPGAQPAQQAAEQQPAYTNTYAQPAYTNTYANPAQQQTVYANAYAPPIQKLTRNQYFFKAAPANLKMINIISLLIGFACLLLIFIPTYRAFNASIFDYPLMGFIPETKELEMEYKDLLDELKEAEEDDELKRAFEIEFGVTLKELEKKHDITLDEFLDLFDPLSVNNFVRLTEIVDPSNDISPILSVVKTVMYVFCVIQMIITALGTAFQKTWVMVLAYILSFGFIALNGGFIFWMLATVSFITAAVLFYKLKKAYNIYLATPTAA